MTDNTVPAASRFHCDNCGADVWMPNLGQMSFELIETDTGRILDVPVDGAVTSVECPNCGSFARAVNQHVLRDPDGRHLLGFADTPEQMEVLRAAVEELRTLHANASLEEVVETLERFDARLQPIADYIREHHSELINYGLTIVGIVIALLAWLAPRQTDPQDMSPPAGISEHDLQLLIDAIRDSAPSEHQHDGGAVQQEKSAPHVDGRDRLGRP